MTFPPEVWSGVLRRLERTLPDFTFEAWIAPLVMGRAHSDRVIVLCPSPFHRERVNNALREPITQAIRDEVGEQPAVDFEAAEASVLEAHALAAAVVPLAGDDTPGFAPDDSAGRPGPGPQVHLPEMATGIGAGSPHPNGPVKEARDPVGVTPLRPPMPKTVAGDSHVAPLADAVAKATSGLGPGRNLATGAARPAPQRMARSGDAAMRAPASIDSLQRTPAAGSRSNTTPAGSAIPLRARMLPAEQTELPWSFENFVVGPCNALAREAAFAVARGQEMGLNQLYLASPPGMGKTHLARAVASEVARRTGRPVRYASAEVFTSEFVSALRNKRAAEFKRRYRPDRGGLLVLEDVQFLAAKRATQLEFFHSVQHVLDGGGRVVLTGDRMPTAMTDLDERVREQLGSGFVAGLEAPDVNVRRQILKTKASRGGIALPEDCLDLLVESFSGNVRELEGVLMQVVTTATLLKRRIDLELTQRAIAQKVLPVALETMRPRIDDVLAVVASFFQTTPDQLAARSRRRAVLVPRQLAMYLSHRHTDAPLAEIGRALGRDHPSVRNAIKKVEREMLENPKLRYQVEALSTRIQEQNQGRNQGPIQQRLS